MPLPHSIDASDLTSFDLCREATAALAVLVGEHIGAPQRARKERGST